MNSCTGVSSFVHVRIRVLIYINSFLENEVEAESMCFHRRFHFVHIHLTCQVIQRSLQLHAPALMLNFRVYRYGLKILEFDMDGDRVLNETEFRRFYNRNTKYENAADTESKKPAAEFCFSQFDANTNKDGNLSTGEILAIGLFSQRGHGNVVHADNSNQAVSTLEVGSDGGSSWMDWVSSMNPFSACLSNCKQCVEQVHREAELERQNDEYLPWIPVENHFRGIIRRHHGDSLRRSWAAGRGPYGVLQATGGRPPFHGTANRLPDEEEGTLGNSVEEESNPFAFNGQPVKLG